MIVCSICMLPVVESPEERDDFRERGILFCDSDEAEILAVE